MTERNALQEAIHNLAFHLPLGSAEATAAFDVIMRGEASETQVAALLTGLRVRGDSPAIIAGAAQSLRSAMVRLSCARPDELVDTCGTGGGAVPTFNISTAAALLAAGAGVRIAKHGNRSFTSKCGSADVLEALGVQIDVPLEVMEKALEEAGLVFMFAPLMHPAMRHVGPVRRELGIPTVMNVVGPLANPASASRQVVGVADAPRAPMLAEALRELGAVHAIVVHGEPGMDELSPLGPTHVFEVTKGQVREWTLDPTDFGFAPATAAELAGGTPVENARVIEEVLTGRGAEGAQSAVVLNAAAAIYVSPKGGDFAQAVKKAQEAMKAGRGLEALNRLRNAYRK